MTMYKVFREKNQKAVLETSHRERAVRALDSMFDSRGGMADKPRHARIEENGVTVEVRRRDGSLRMIHEEREIPPSPMVPAKSQLARVPAGMAISAVRR